MAEQKERKKWTGKGIGVAVLDTGIFPHMDFDAELPFLKILSAEEGAVMTITDTEPMWPGSLRERSGFRRKVLRNGAGGSSEVL